MPRKKRASIDLPAAFPSPPKKKAREQHYRGRWRWRHEIEGQLDGVLQISLLSGLRQQKSLGVKCSITGDASIDMWYVGVF